VFHLYVFKRYFSVSTILHYSYVSFYIGVNEYSAQNFKHYLCIDIYRMIQSSSTLLKEVAREIVSSRKCRYVTLCQILTVSELGHF
jgi:hypothetical protein